MNAECSRKIHCNATPRRRRRTNDQAQHSQTRPVDLPEFTSTYLDFSVLGSRPVLASFDGGHISSDGGSLLLRRIEQLTGIIRQFAAGFTDHRHPQLIEPTREHLVAQRIYALALGQADLNDHDDLRLDPLLATSVGKKDPTGQDRLKDRDKGKALAGKSTLHRLELTPVGADKGSRSKKIICSTRAVDDLFVELFLQAYSVPPERLVLDLDATNDPIPGDQLGRFFHGHYQEYCFLPLYIFCDDHLLCARLRPADLDASAGSLKQLQRIIARIRQAWPKVKILVRGDSGFCREPILAWWAGHSVDYVFGLAQNPRLLRMITAQSEAARGQYDATKQPARVFADLRYQTLDSWSCQRRVVAQAEHLEKGANPRFVVTALSLQGHPAKALQEVTDCGRGAMENRIQEQQLHWFADWTSAEPMRANPIRWYFSSVASTLLEALGRLGLRGTAMAQAECPTIRLRLLKIGALVQVTVRTVWIRLASSCPSADVFGQAVVNRDRLRPVVLRC